MMTHEELQAVYQQGPEAVLALIEPVFLLIVQLWNWKIKGDTIGSIIEYLSDGGLFGRCFDVIIRRKLDLDPMTFAIEIYFEELVCSIPKYI